MTDLAAIAARRRLALLRRRLALPRRRLHFAINRSNSIYRLGMRRHIQHDLPQSCKFPRREGHS